jgi:hypothetical protein
VNIVKALRSFGAFWYDFIIGDDPFVAIGVIVAFGATAALAHNDVTAWWLMPIVVAVLLGSTLARAVRRR